MKYFNIILSKALLPILFVCMTLVLFWKVLTGLVPFPGNYLMAWYEPWKTETLRSGTLGIPHKPVLDDVFRQIYPDKIFLKEMIEKGELPFWNPYNGSGMPLLATMHAGFLTPTTVLFLLFSGPLAWTIYIMIQPLLFSFGCYWYTRILGFSKMASLFSIVIFVLSGFAVVRYEFGEYLYVASCLPYLLAIIEHYRRNPFTRVVYLLPFIVCLMMLSGQPQMILYVLFMYGFYTWFLCRMSKVSIIPILLLFLFGIGMSAVQLVPTFELYLNANMTQGASQFIFDRFLLPINHYISFFIPNYFGNQATYNYWGSGDYVESILYVGMIPTLFALTAISRKYTKTDTYICKFYGITIAVTILLTFGWVFTRILYRFPIPVFSTGIPSRIFFLTTFSVSILSGYGFDIFLQKKKVCMTKPLVVSLEIAGFICLYTVYLMAISAPCNNTSISACRLIALRNTLLESAVFVSACVCVLLHKRIGIISGFLVIFIYIVSGLYNANKFLPFSSYNSILPNTAVIEQIKKYTGFGRTIGIGTAEISTDIATHFHFYDPQYYEPLYIRRYGELLSYAKTGDKMKGLTRSDVSMSNWNRNDGVAAERMSRLAQLCSISFAVYKKIEIPKDSMDREQIVWEDDQWLIRKNQFVLPRIYIVPSYEFLKDEEQILKRLFDLSFNPDTSVVLEKSIPDWTEPVTPQAIRAWSADIASYRENDVHIQTSSVFDGFLVLTDNYYPGWKAYIDGKETPILRANYSFRAILLSKGEHSVSFVYRPLSFMAGFAISVFCLCLTLIYMKLKVQYP